MTVIRPSDLALTMPIVSLGLVVLRFVWRRRRAISGNLRFGKWTELDLHYDSRLLNSVAVPDDVTKSQKKESGRPHRNRGGRKGRKTRSPTPRS